MVEHWVTSRTYSVVTNTVTASCRNYKFLLKRLHPAGLKCKRGHILPSGQKPHDRSRDPIFDYRCRVCGNVFNIFSNTAWEGTQYGCPTIVLVMRGFTQGAPTLQLAEELVLDYGTLLDRRHKVQKLALEHNTLATLGGIDTA